MRRRTMAAAALLTALVATACSGAPAPAGSAAPSTLASLQLSAVLHETRPDVVAGVMQVLTANAGPSPVRILSMQLRWPGLTTVPPTAEFPPEGYPLDVDRRADMAVDYGPAVCGAGPPPTTGAGAVAQVAVGARAPQQVDLTFTDADSGTLLLQHWRSSCTQQRLDRAVSVGFDPTWVPSTVAGVPALRGTIVLRRVEGHEPVSVVVLQGSVLLDMLPVGPLVTIAPTAQGARQRVDLLTSGRCTFHELGQSTQTFLLSTNVRVGADTPVTVMLSPDPATQARLTRVIAAGCGH